MTSFAFTPDGGTVFTASADGTIRGWRLRRDDLLALVDRRITRPFSPQERERYAELLGGAATGR